MSTARNFGLATVEVKKRKTFHLQPGKCVSCNAGYLKKTRGYGQNGYALVCSNCNYSVSL